MCIFEFRCNVINYFICYDLKKFLNLGNIWIGGCEYSKLSCRIRWFGNESKNVELFGSKLYWYLLEFM